MPIQMAYIDRRVWATIRKRARPCNEVSKNTRPMLDADEPRDRQNERRKITTHLLKQMEPKQQLALDKWA